MPALAVILADPLRVGPPGLEASMKMEPPGGNGDFVTRLEALVPSEGKLSAIGLPASSKNSSVSVPGAEAELITRNSVVKDPPTAMCGRTCAFAAKNPNPAVSRNLIARLIFAIVI